MIIKTEENDDFDDIFNEDETSGGDNESIESLLGETEEPPKREKKDYKDLFEKAKKSYKHQQRFVSEIQNKIKEMEEAGKKRDESEKVRMEKLKTAFGIEDKSDEEAKKLIAEFEENPISVIDKRIEERMGKELPGLKDNVELTRMTGVIGKLKEEIESEYEFEFTPGIEIEVANVLNESFAKSDKMKNPRRALLRAVQIVSKEKLKKPLKKRGDNLIFVDRGKVVGGKFAETSPADKIKKGILGARRTTKKIFE